MRAVLLRRKRKCELFCVTSGNRCVYVGAFRVHNIKKKIDFRGYRDYALRVFATADNRPRA